MTNILEKMKFDIESIRLQLEKENIVTAAEMIKVLAVELDEVGLGRKMNTKI